MAQVTLGRLEAEQGALPPVCLRCGRPAVLYRARRFGWQPGYTYLCLLVTIWPFLLVSLLAHRRMRVLGPWCWNHRHYGLIRWALFSFAVGFLGAVLALVTAWLITFTGAQNEGPQQIVASWIAGILLLAILLIARINSLRPIEITSESITLTGVADAFVERRNVEKTLAWGLRGPVSASRRSTSPDERPESGPTGQHHYNRFQEFLSHKPPR
jgi:hypothetical protein